MGREGGDCGGTDRLLVEYIVQLIVSGKLEKQTRMRTPIYYVWLNK